MKKLESWVCAACVWLFFVCAALFVSGAFASPPIPAWKAGEVELFGPKSDFCIPAAEKIRARTGATIFIVEGHYNEMHAIACKDGLCGDNGLLSTTRRGARRAFRLQDMDPYYKVVGPWTCPDGVATCEVFGRTYTAERR